MISLHFGNPSPIWANCWQSFLSELKKVARDSAVPAVIWASDHNCRERISTAKFSSHRSARAPQGYRPFANRYRRHMELAPEE
jgi:hypothetical protein